MLAFNTEEILVLHGIFKIENSQDGLITADSGFAARERRALPPACRRHGNGAIME
jgi:hypothetical protein